MKKVIKIAIIFFISFLFIFNIDVNAEEMECHYRYSYNKNNIGNKELYIYIDLTYDGKKISIDKKIDTSTSPAIIRAELSIPDTIQESAIKNNNNEYACPFFGLSSTYNPSRSGAIYDIGLTLNSVKSGEEKLIAYQSVIPDSFNQTNPDDPNSDNYEDNDILFNCTYNDKSDQNVLSFKINKNGYIQNVTLMGEYSNNQITRDTTLSFDKCPTYIKPTCGYGVCNVTFSEESGEWIYIGSGNNADGVNQDLVTIYKQYNNPKAPKVQILKNGEDGFRIVSDNKSIENTNISDLSNKFNNGDYPRYLIKLNGSTNYIFLDSLKDENGKNLQVEEIYINVNYLGTSGTGLSDEMAIKTCKELFGNDFLEFLNDYVFKIIWIGVPILLILLTTFDFAKVVFVDDKEGIQNAFNRLWKRAIAAILVFLTPYIIILIANIIDPTQTTIQSCAKKIREMGSTSYIVK